MALLSAHKLSKSYGGRTLFSDVSFEIAPKDRIGLVGANGTGKTTLLRILNGEDRPDAGELHRAKLLRIATLQQIPALHKGQTTYDLALECFAPLFEMENELQEIARLLEKEGADYTALIRRQHLLQERFQNEGGLTCRSRARAALLGLGFREEELAQPAQTLSGGQLNKVMLSRVLLQEADILLLDEPTNHLDIQAVEWLEGFLKAYAGAYCVISHDRYFLDQVATRMMEITTAGFFCTQGNYSRHVELRLDEQEFIRRKYNNTQQEIRRIYGIVEQQRRWNRERNIRMAESKLKQIARLEQTLVAPQKEDSAIRFVFQARATGGNDVLMAEGLEKAFGTKCLFRDVHLHIRRGERVFLLGPNGCGKTTLLNMLSGREPADAGGSMLGAGVEVAYYEQSMRGMPEENTVLQEVWDAYPRLNRTQVHNALAAFLFRGEDVQKTIGMLSGGERARVQLLKLMLSGANLLLLDEPTNHLDIASREALEQALEEFDGAYIVVTHDRYLVNRLADRVLYMQPGGMRETIGGYDAAMLETAQEEEEAPVDMKDRPGNDYQRKKERQLEQARLRGHISVLEKDIEQYEREIERLEAALADPALMSDYQAVGQYSEQLSACRAQLEKAYEAWEEAACGMEALKEEV